MDKQPIHDIADLYSADFDPITVSMTPNAQMHSEFLLESAGIISILEKLHISTAGRICIVGALSNETDIPAFADDPQTNTRFHYIRVLTEAPGPDKRDNRYSYERKTVRRKHHVNHEIVKALGVVAAEYKTVSTPKPEIINQLEKRTLRTYAASTAFIGFVGYHSWQSINESYGELVAAPSVASLAIVSLYAAYQRVKSNKQRSIRQQANAKNTHKWEYDDKISDLSMRHTCINQNNNFKQN